MTNKTKLGLGILGGGLLVGILGDSLLRADGAGLNFTLSMLLLIAVGVGLARWRKLPLASLGRWLITPLLFFSIAFAWRDSPTLQMLDILALLITLVMATLCGNSIDVRRAGLWQYLCALVLSGVNTCAGWPLLVRQVEWATIPLNGRSRQTRAVVIGLVLAIPILFIFGGLFASADAVFKKFTDDLFHFNLGNIVSHLFFIAFLSWIVAGYLRGALIAADKPVFAQNISKAGPLGPVEISVVLGLLNILFLSFVIIQIRYFFGGAALVHATTGLTYAVYARSGFFELVTVAILVLPLLLSLHWLLNRENPMGERVFRGLAGALVLMLFVIMASAVQRMHLYQNEYGLTELRFYTMAFMAWLAAVFVWFAVTVLRGQRERFVFGALIASFIGIAALQMINPDLLIVRANIARAVETKHFDTDYGTSLSADTAPALVRALPVLDPKVRKVIATSVLKRWTRPKNSDWRAWTWGKFAAWGTVQRNAVRLHEAAGS